MRKRAGVACNLHVNLVFVTKYRRDVFPSEMLRRRGHVHLLVHYPPKVAISRLMNSFKGVSSRRLRQELTDNVNLAILHGRLSSGSYFAGLEWRSTGNVQALGQGPAAARPGSSRTTE